MSCISSLALGARPVLPLAGVTVLELSQILAGPTCGLMLADMGATVIKVEKFPGGDDARGYARPGDRGLAASFVLINRGKRSLALDVRTAEGRDVIKRMVRQADIITENFRPGTMERLGLGYDDLAVENPKLIYCSISGYGRKGPLANRGGFDLILQAFSGLMSVTGEAGGRRVKSGNSVADINAGILAAFGTLAGYINFLRTGIGTRVDTSLLQASLQQMYWFAAAWFAERIIGTPAGAAHPLIAPYETFECKDGEIALGGANQANWERIAKLLHHAEWIADPRFVSGAKRLAHRAELVTLISIELKQNTVAHWVAAFEAANVPVGPVNDIAQALEHDQARAIGMVVDVSHPEGGTTRSIGSPVTLGEFPYAATSAAPRLGQHSTAVLREFGFNSDEISALVANNVVYQHAHAARDGTA